MITNEEVLEIIEQAAKDRGTYLNLCHEDLTALPKEIGNLTNLTQLHLGHNPLTSPPPKIVEQGAQAVLAYLREQV